MKRTDEFSKNLTEEQLIRRALLSATEEEYQEALKREQKRFAELELKMYLARVIHLVPHKKRYLIGTKFCELLPVSFSSLPVLLYFPF